ncbi:MAG: hypothetical protein KAI76_04290 [Alphaproteobacteria bacterium]|nr:hypothetical protein [Alphaproteobacteria bacterium]
MSKKTVLGIIEFSSPLFCSAEALGKAVDIEIGDHAGTLIFPVLPEWGENEDDPLSKNLIAPDEAKTWKRGGKILCWGKPSNYPSGESFVNIVLVKMNVLKDDVESAAKDIYESFDTWLNLFEQYVMLLTTQNIRCGTTGGDGSGHIELFDNRKDKLNYISRSSSVNMTYYIYGDDVSLHLDQLKEAASLSSKNLPLRLEYQMLLQAYRAIMGEDYRKAIIEAASALEISLTKRIKEEFQNQNISFGEKLLKKYRMLGGRFELVRVLGIPLPNKD